MSEPSASGVSVASGAPVRLGQGERTRQVIVETALRLFAEQGYERTTMRAIADAAGVSVGNAYYYFRSKDHLVQQFYGQIQQAHRERAAEALRQRAFAHRLRGVWHAGIDTMAPYHDFAGSFVRVAIDPGSPSSPFSAESAEAREPVVALFREVVDGSRPAVDGQLRDDLPELLWLAYLGVTLYWVYDKSAGQARTRRLINLAAPLTGRLLRLARLPGTRRLTADVLALVKAARP